MRLVGLAMLGRFARPAALLFVWRSAGAQAAEHAALFWIAVGVGAQLSLVGLDRALVRLLPEAARTARRTLVLTAVAVTACLGVVIGLVLATALHTAALAVVVPGLALLNLALATRITSRGTRHVSSRTLLLTACTLAISDALDLVAKRADQVLFVLLFRSSELVAMYVITRELVMVTLGRDALELVGPRFAKLVRALSLVLAVGMLLLVPVHTPAAFAIAAIIVAGRCLDVATAASYISLVTFAAPSLAITATATELVVLAGSATLLTPLAIALGAALAPIARNLTARHFLES